MIVEAPTMREAVASDSDVIFALTAKLGTSFEIEKLRFEDSFNRILSDDSAIIVIAEDKNRVVGYGLGSVHPIVYANGNSSWLEELFVSADYRKQGVGRSLMDAFQDWAKSKNSALVALATRRAAGFYVALGYEESAQYVKKLLS